MTNTELEERLEKYRLTPRELAILFSCTRAAVDHWLRGSRKIPGTVTAYFRLLDVATKDVVNAEYEIIRAARKGRR